MQYCIIWKLSSLMDQYQWCKNKIQHKNLHSNLQCFTFSYLEVRLCSQDKNSHSSAIIDRTNMLYYKHQTMYHELSLYQSIFIYKFEKCSLCHRNRSLLYNKMWKQWNQDINFQKIFQTWVERESDFLQEKTIWRCGCWGIHIIS